MSTSRYDFINQMDSRKETEANFFVSCSDRVRKFNLAAQGGFLFTDEIIKKQRDLVEEELMTELLVDGIQSENRTLVIDALCDIFVVSTYWDFITELKYISEIHSCNGAYSVDDIIKDAKESAKSPFIDLSTKYTLSELVSSMVEGYIADTPSEVVSNCASIMTRADFDYQKALREVLDSNDSKIPTLEEFISKHLVVGNKGSLDYLINIEEKDIEKRNNGRYNGVVGRVVNGRVVFKDSNGKIMKPLTFFEPNLSGL